MTAPIRSKGDPRLLEVGDAGSWMRPPGGDVVALRTRKPLARIVVALAEARLARPGVAVTRAELIERGWPGERIVPEAARNRLGVALTTLRKLGLGDLLERARDGYRIAADVTVVLAPSEPPAA